MAIQDYISKESALTEWMVAFGTMGLALLALFGSKIKSSIFKPRLDFKKIKITSQSIGNGRVLLIYRLIIENKGSIISSPAYNVRAVMSDIKEKNENNHYESRENFVPAFLNWTHFNRGIRNISNEEIAYLDIIQYEGNKYEICWPLSIKPLDQDLLNFDRNKEYDLTIDFFEKSRKLDKIVLHFNPSKNILKIKKDS